MMFEAPSDNIWDKMYAACYAAQYVSQGGGGIVSRSWSVAEFAQETGVCVYSSLHQPNAGWFKDGGTSIAAPALSGIINAANHRQSSSFNELSYIYNNALKNYYSHWHDILQGNNGYPALMGYDFTTGLGSPSGYGGK
jgi:hypothetical protein